MKTLAHSPSAHTHRATVPPVLGDMKYSAGDDCTSYHEPISRFDFPRGQRLYGRDWSMIVDELADDFHSNHDGWEASWPLQIRVYERGQEVARFQVEREYEPSFIAWELDPPATAEQPGTPEGVNQKDSAA